MSAAGWGERDGPRERDAQGRRIRAEGWMIFLLAAPPVDFLAVCLVLAIGWVAVGGEQTARERGQGMLGEGCKGIGWKYSEAIGTNCGQK